MKQSNLRRREKLQSDLSPAGNGDAFCAIFLLGNFADALSASPCCRRVIQEIIFEKIYPALRYVDIGNT